MKANTSIKLLEKNQNPFSESEGGIKLAHNNFIMEYTGEMQGEGIEHELWINYPDNTADVYGIERFTGSIGGKKGSFVTEHKGRFEGGKIKKTMTIVKDSGTGELKGISGGSRIESGPAEKFPIVYEYEIK
jgi:hypothetical protein